MRTFLVIRTTDVSGVSGTGVVAEGVQLKSGKIFIEWYGELHSWEFHQDMETFLKVHGHGGRTHIEWDK